MINHLHGTKEYPKEQFHGNYSIQQLKTNPTNSFKFEFLNEFTMVPWDQIGNDRIIKFELRKLKLDPVYHELNGNVTEYIKYFLDYFGCPFFIMNLDSDDHYLEVKVHKCPKVIIGNDKVLVVSKNEHGWWVRFNWEYPPFKYTSDRYTKMLEDIIGKIN